MQQQLEQQMLNGDALAITNLGSTSSFTYFNENQLNKIKDLSIAFRLRYDRELRESRKLFKKPNIYQIITGKEDSTDKYEQRRQQFINDTEDIEFFETSKSF